MEFQALNDMPKTIDEIFGRFNKRAELILSKYDKGFAELEDELKLSAQLKIIQQRKEKLENELNFINDPKCGDTPADSTRTEIETVNKLPDESLCEPDDANEELKDSVSEKELLRAQHEKLHKNQNGNSPPDEKKDAANELRRKLQLSIQLAAKYKEQVINLENNLNRTARSEHSLRLYLYEAAQKEEEAKKRLESFITGLLDRAENAEEKVKIYRTKLRAMNSIVNESHQQTVPRVVNVKSMGYSQDSYTSDTVANNKNNRSTAQKHSHSLPTTPFMRPPRKMKKSRSRKRDDDYVAQFLEPPSSQELPRRWNKMKDRNVDQLPGIDLTNIISTSVVWPFSHSQADKKRSKNQKDVVIRRRIVLFCVFAYLETEQLLTCAMVSREWRDVSKHQKLWTRISFDSKQFSSKFLVNMSAWCKQTCYLSLSNITGRNKRQGETQKEYEDSVSGSLEEGMECVLQACGNNLMILSVTQCDPFLTRRVLWMASCYNRELKSITFRSCNPIDEEVTWSLGSGCHKLLSLDIAPMPISKSPQVFNNRVIQMVSWCWPSLRGLSIGGRCIDKKGLNSIATNCRLLQVLELTYMNEITENLSRELVKSGLRSLRSLILTHTPIRPRALGVLLRLAQEGSLVGARVQLSFSDYCPTDGNQPVIILNDKLDRSALFEAYSDVMQSLMRMQKKEAYRDVLEIVFTS